VANITNHFIFAMFTLAIALVLAGGSYSSITGAFGLPGEGGNPPGFNYPTDLRQVSYPYTLTADLTVTRGGNWVVVFPKGTVLDQMPNFAGTLNIVNNTATGILSGLEVYYNTLVGIGNSLNSIFTVMTAGIANFHLIAEIPIFGGLLILYWTSVFAIFVIRTIFAGGD